MEREGIDLSMKNMIIVALILLLFVSLAAGESTRGLPDERIPTEKWAVHLNPGENPDPAAKEMGAENLGQIAGLADMYLFRFPESKLRDTADAVRNKLKQNTKVRWSEQQIARWHYPRAMPTDPLFNQQWHLKNNGQSGSTPGEDINVAPVWESGNTGQGIVIAIVDDGLNYSHPDILPNYRPDLSYDFNYNDSDPSPFSYDYHGTACAGVAAAASNTTCGVGAAYGAYLSALRLVATADTDADDAESLSYKADAIQIYSSSWGPSDDGRTLEGPGTLLTAALENNIRNGRGGLGNIYVWAGGNGGSRGDNVNYDGYANSRYTIAVGATDHHGKKASYSEPGAPLIACTPSDDDSAYIITTALSGCKTDFGGTSAVAPMVSGVIALMLHANPNLGWRDVQHILIRSAAQNDPTDSDWKLNGAGFHVNHKYGFGRVNAAKAVELSKFWQNVPKETATTFGVGNVRAKSIPDNNSAGISSTITISESFSLEHVEVIFQASHPYRGDLKIVLTSPSGTQSVLAESHSDSNADYNWKFMSVRHWGELSAGNWTLTVSDLKSGNTGTFDAWGLMLYGNYSDVTDVIGVLRILADIPADGKFIRSDKKTGMEEAIYLLQQAAGLR